MNKFIIGAVFVFCYCLMTASSAVLVNYSEKVINPLSVSFYSFLFSMLLFNLINFRDLAVIKSLYAKHFNLVVIFNITTGIMWGAVFYSLKYLNPDIFVAIFFGTNPIVTVLLTLNQPKSTQIRRAEFIFAVILCAILIVLIANNFYLEHDKYIKILCVGLAMLSASMGAVTNIVAHKLAALRFPATVVLSQRFHLLIILSAILLFCLHIDWILPISHYFTILLVALASLALPLFFLQKGLEKTDPVFVSLVTPFVPVITFFITLLEPDIQFDGIKLLMLSLLSITILLSVVLRRRGKS